jgi:DNA-binding NarL/FixJ family response regulator
VSGNRSHNGWSRELTVLDGGAAHRRRSDRSGAVIHVLLAEPVGLVRAGLHSLLEREPDLRVAGEAVTGDEAVARAAELRPDVVLMDMRVPGLGALAATERIVADSDRSEVRVVMLTASEAEEDLFGALRAGASGFMALDTDPDELVRAVRIVAGGGAQLSPSATARVLDEITAVPDAHLRSAQDFEELTIRERDIVVLAALGLTNGEIAQRLVISPATVKTHVSRAMRKLGADTRAKLVALAHQSGFVRHHPPVDASPPPVASAVSWRPSIAG